MPNYCYESCDLTPWVAEIVTRMHEAAAQGINIVNLSFTHPRGYIPNQIIRRPAVQKLLSGWSYNNARFPPEVAPTRYWQPDRRRNIDWNYCPLEPFIEELNKREQEAVRDARKLSTEDRPLVPIIDLTTYHPRGCIPERILERIERRANRDWREEMEDFIKTLEGEANKAEALAGTMKDKAEGVASKGGDPAALLSAIQEQLQKAAERRQQIESIRLEMGGAA